MSRFPSTPPKAGPGASVAPGGLVMRADRSFMDMPGESLARQNGLVGDTRRRQPPQGSNQGAKSDLLPQG